jgi:ribosome biogenesis protein Nip4
MKSNQDIHTLTAIQSDMLRELHNNQEKLIHIIDKKIDEQTFHAMKYKERECYEALLELRELRNTLQVFLQVTRQS